MKKVMGIAAGLAVFSCLGLFGCSGDDDDADVNTVNVTNVTTVAEEDDADPAPGPAMLYTTTESWAMHATKAAGAVAPAAGTITALVVSHMNSDMRMTLEKGGATVAGPSQGANVSLSTPVSAGQHVQAVVFNPSGVAVTCTLTLTYNP